MNEMHSIRANIPLFETFPLLRHLEGINPPFVTITKPFLSNKIGETFCEGLK